MLVALGFLAATLLALLIAPAFWSRAVRLTTARIKDSMPLTETEIQADKDRIRAEYAIKVHKLESLVEQVRLSGARQQIELNRRDATINELEGAHERLKAAFEENENARRVLEQTVADRLPRVEQRLSETKRLLLTRDREISELSQTADRQRRAIAEAASINTQQQAEIERLQSALETRAARNQAGTADPRFDGELALRAEIESLRAKTREQAQLLTRLQSLSGTTSPPQLVVVPGDTKAAAGSSDDSAAPPVDDRRLLDLERQVRTLKARNDDQAAEITRLKAAIAVFESEADGEMTRGSIRESRIALKARLQSLEAQSNQHSETIQRLRSELAAANERLARQAAHFSSELKRLGAGTLPASGQARRPAEPARLSLADRVAQARLAPRTEPNSEVERDSAQVNGAHAHQSEPAEVARLEPVAAAGSDGATRGDGAAKPTPPAAEGERRGRLLDRISSLSRGS